MKKYKKVFTKLAVIRELVEIRRLTTSSVLREKTVKTAEILLSEVEELLLPLKAQNDKR